MSFCVGPYNVLTKIKNKKNVLTMSLQKMEVSDEFYHRELCDGFTTVSDSQNFAMVSQSFSPYNVLTKIKIKKKCPYNVLTKNRGLR